ncbi:TRAP transporter substrate-binding protein [Chelatococcus composti]|uniref:TRAP-type mannitol/chloroaromatic compound transport system substrate-binding protein n=1 Tax=Chelatococcus composti TaxID=1743235 RepID=A0A841KEC6_9HYPH|nr:TRAP transporter substrate-binding protein [Chelatococcus composti]MBB6168296.1 TRAP-type mannitol/chloroaromatic compound transport system substrate-binding protein [Chelatococcus composti]MBS7736620.1 TRAP transporter substrate-binding protein [Chelatococcus composti]GGG38955.1 ABC transporter substrate-binding protein [Chelatococcus composti]
MKRRQFLQTAGAGLVAGTVASPAIAQSAPEIRWRLTSSYPKSLDTIYGGAEVLARAVSEATDGRFQIQVFAAGEIVPSLQALDAVQNGTVEMCHSAPYFYVGKDPTFAFGTAVPFGLNTRQQNAWFNHADGMTLLNELFGRFGAYGLPGGNTTAQMGGWFRKEIKTVDDLKGLKMRIGGLGGQVLARLGVVPQQIAGGDIYPALEKGSLDAAEWAGPYDDEKLGFQKVAPYYYYPGFWEGGASIHFFINKAKWEELPKNYQAIVRQAAAFANADMMEKYDARNPAALKSLVAGGAQLRPFSQDILEAAFKATSEIFDEIAARNDLFKRTYESMKRFRNDEYLWWQVCEYTYDNFMIRNRTRG